MCSKIQYTKKEAEAILKRIPKHRTKRKKPVRAYQCPKCNFWHLTSKEYSEEKPREIENPEFKKFLKQEA